MERLTFLLLYSLATIFESQLIIMSSSAVNNLPSHPTLIYITKLLHYAGYTSIAFYLVALCLLKPLLNNKANLLKYLYKNNVKQLNNLYTMLAKKFNIVPSVLINYNGKQYSDATTQTEKDKKYDFTRYDKNAQHDSRFDRSTFVTTSLSSLEKAEVLSESLRLFNERLTMANTSTYLEDLNFRVNEFNNQLQSDRFGHNQIFDKNDVIPEINSKIRKMKGFVLTN